MSAAPRRRATIVTVAREAGVAASTVSRTFTSPHRVNHATRDHVLAVAERLGYTPNPAAQALESGRTNAVALLVPDLADPSYAGVIKGVERAAAEARLTLVLGDTGQDPATEQALVRRLGPAVDGFVLVAPRLPGDALRRAADLNAIVLVDRASEGVPSVVADYGAGTRDIVEHLASLGHRSFVFLGGPAESWSQACRWAGLEAAAGACSLGATRLGRFAPTIASGSAAADAVLQARATAVVAHHDLLAIGVLRCLVERGVAVPGDVTVIGFDDILGADFCDPPLTTLAERSTDLGAAAVEALVVHARPSGAHAPAVRVLPTRLVVRESSGAAAKILLERPCTGSAAGECDDANRH